MGQIVQETHHPGGRMTWRQINIVPHYGSSLYVRGSPEKTFEVETTTNVYRGLTRWGNFVCLKLK
jgi:hypothetical protein